MTVPPFPVSTASVRLARRREVRADRAVRGQRQPANVGTRAAAPCPTGKRRAARRGQSRRPRYHRQARPQLPPQSIPEGELVTVPAPFPRRLDSERVRLARRREVRADRAVRGQRQPANVGTRAAAPRPTGKRRAALGAAVKTTSLPPASSPRSCRRNRSPRANS